MNRLKRTLPTVVLKTLYYSLVHPHLLFQLLAWGHRHEELFLLQKRAIRIISNEHWLAHTDPLFKRHNILKLSDLHTLQQIKFYWRYVNDELPSYLSGIPFPKNNFFHSYPTRHNDDFRPPRPNTEYDRNVIRNSLPPLLNDLPPCVSGCFDHTINSLVSAFKEYTLQTYPNSCISPDCYSCSVRLASFLNRTT